MTSAILLFAVASSTAAAQAFKTLYDEHDWFGLRDAVAQQASAPPFYRGAVAYAFHDLAQAEKHLRLVMRDAAGLEQVDDAGVFLINIGVIRGDYRQAMSAVSELRSKSPNARGLDSAGAIFGVLSAFPKQSVSSRRPINVAYSMRDGNLFIPVSINGKVAHYMVDTGANFSLISESEAKRAGMSVLDAPSGHTRDAAGNVIETRVAVANKLSIGDFELRNVAFLVVSDQQPFVDLPEGWRGILGISVILAVETVRWGDGRFEAAFASRRSPVRDMNMCFDGVNPFLLADYRGKAIHVFLDTGASKTRAMPAFVKKFPEIMITASTGVATIRGVGGSAKVDSATLPKLALRIGGHDVVMESVETLLKNAGGGDARFHVWAGLDLFPEPHRVTIDFRSMTFTLE